MSDKAYFIIYDRMSFDGLYEIESDGIEAMIKIGRLVTEYGPSRVHGPFFQANQAIGFALQDLAHMIELVLKVEKLQLVDAIDPTEHNFDDQIVKMLDHMIAVQDQIENAKVKPFLLENES